MISAKIVTRSVSKLHMEITWYQPIIYREWIVSWRDVGTGEDYAKMRMKSDAGAGWNVTKNGAVEPVETRDEKSQREINNELKSKALGAFVAEIGFISVMFKYKKRYVRISVLRILLKLLLRFGNIQENTRIFHCTFRMFYFLFFIYSYFFEVWKQVFDLYL